MMNFKRLSEAYFSGSQADRAKSSIEYKSLSGKRIGPGASSCQMSFTAKGTGELEFFRRGDFMERGDAFPGLWRAKCDPNQLEKAWDKLGDLSIDSFPSRVADPGDTISFISGFFPDQVESLSWGPPDHRMKAPGDDFLIALAPLMNIAADGEPDWTLEMLFAGISHSQFGTTIQVDVVNKGKKSIGIALTKSENRGGFALRYAIDRDVAPGITRLPVEWTWCSLEFLDRKSDMLWLLEPGKPVRITLHSKLQLETPGKYIGKIQYEQSEYLDSLSGIPILSGSAFTEGFEFVVS
jgi:hypothetical protein